jgi:non-ribosomal peptide synthase protein (TIGR01720 family)
MLRSVMSSLIYPLLPEQARFLTRGLPNDDHWNVAVMFQVPERLTAGMWGAAVRSVINRHDGLRQSLREDRTRFGRVAPPLEEFPVAFEDLRALPADAQAAAMTSACTRLHTSISLTQAPLLRAGYFVLAGGQRRVVLILHHFVCDAMSVHLIVGDLERACQRVLDGRGPQVPPPPTSATDYALWLRQLADSTRLRAQLPLWLRIGRPAEPVPVDESGENTLASSDTVDEALGKATTAQVLSELSRRRLGLNEAFATAAVAALHGSGPDHSLRANLLVHGRRAMSAQPDVGRTVGWLATCYPVSLHLDTTVSFSRQLDTAAEVFHAVPDGGLGFGVLRFMNPDLRVCGSLAAQGAAELTINYLGRTGNGGTPTMILRRAAESTGTWSTSNGPRMNIHYLQLYIAGGELHVTWEYSRNQFKRSTIESYVEELLGRVSQGLAS